jgi:hypothetical protein
MTLNERQMEMCKSSTWDFSDLRTLFLNCTLKRTPEKSPYRIRHPAAGRRGLDRRRRSGSLVSRSRLRRPGKRFHEPQHNFYDVEPVAYGAYD